MPMRNYPRYSGGSGLADLLSGLADGYKMGSALKSQRDADKLARDREARYVAEEAAKRKQQDLQNERNRLEDAAQGRFASTDGLDLTEQVTTRDNSDARSVLGATRALGALPGMDVSSLAPLLKNTTENRYQATGGGALDRVRTDPVLQTTLKNEATRQTGLQESVEQDRSARALDGIAPGAGQALRAGASADASLRFADGQVGRQRQQAEIAQQQAQAAEVAQRLYGLSPEVAQAAAGSGLLGTVLKGIEDQRNDDRSLRNSLTSIRETARLRPTPAGATSPTGAPVTFLPTSEDERKSAFHYVLGSQAVDILAGQDGDLTGEMAARVPLIGNVIQGAVAPKQQAMDQAAKQLAESYIFAITGAAAPESQMARLIETIKPLAGDDEATKAQKEQTRASYLRAIKARAGRAYTNMQAQGIIAQDGTIPKPGAVDPEAEKAAAEAKALYNRLVLTGTPKDEARRQVQTIYGGRQ